MYGSEAIKGVYSICFGIVAYLGVTYNIYNTLWVLVTYQIYTLVPAIYDSFTRLLRSLIHSSYIAVTRLYIWYVTVIHNIFVIYIYISYTTGSEYRSE